MPKHDDESLIITDEDEKSGPILIDDAYVAKRLKEDPELAREYEALRPKYARLERQIEARKARRARRKALVKQLRGFWATLMRGLKQPLGNSHE
ncbi:MAG: hypothetical protein MJE68_14925 [Proteobacteria bacterium]|nr:hypothetical protein [Pseudomonadota bacterium]